MKTLKDLPPLKRSIKIKHPRADLFFTAGPGLNGCLLLVGMLIAIDLAALILTLFGLSAAADSTGQVWMFEAPIIPLACIAAVILATVFVWWPASLVAYRIFRNLNWTGMVEFRGNTLVAIAYHNEWTRSIDLSRDFHFETIKKIDTDEFTELRGKDLDGRMRTTQVRNADLSQAAIVFKQDSTELVLWCYIRREGTLFTSLNGERFADREVPAGFEGSLQFDEELLSRIQLRMQDIAHENGVIPTRPL